MKSTPVDSGRSSFDRARIVDRPTSKSRRANRRRFESLECLEARLLMHGADDPVEALEHLHAFGTILPSGAVIGGLVPDSIVTDRSVASGNWGSASTWSAGVPKAGDVVAISSGTTVTVDGIESQDASGNRLALRAMRVDGTLGFSTTASTKLLVDTIIVEPKGSWIEGTAASPIPANVTAEVSFADGMDASSRDINVANDPYQFGRGLVSHGAVSIYGSEVASDVMIAPTSATAGTTALAKGATELLAQGPAGAPQGWKVGDRLVITGDTATNAQGVDQDQQVAYRGIDPKTGAIVFSPGLTVALTAPSGASLHVADVSRNVVFDSESISLGDFTVAHRGHLMFMHNPNVHLDAVGIYGLGRTDKRNPIDDAAPVEDVAAELALAAAPGSALPADDYLSPAVGATYSYVADAQGNLTYATAVGKDGKPILDVNGQPVPMVMTTDVIDAKTGLRVMSAVVDAAGNPVPLYLDANGKTIPVPVGTTPPIGSTPLYQSGADGKPSPVLDQYGKPVVKDGVPQYYPQYETQAARSGLNVRGRYALHFHRAGTAGVDLATANDISVVDSPGWGIVNHSSNVAVTGSVVFNATGAAYATEAGDEAGSFDHDLAIHSLGSGAGIESRENIGDFGHEGVGFWLQGGNVSVTNDVATGQRSSGFVFFPVGLNQAGLGTTRIDFDELTPAVQDAILDIRPDVAKAVALMAKGGPEVTIADGDVPLLQFSNNVAFADGDGLETWFSQLNYSDADLARVAADSTPAAPEALKTVVTGTTIWGVNGTAIFDPYTNSATFSNDTLIARATGQQTGLGRNDVTRNLTYVADSIQGFNVGIDVPVNGTSTIAGGTFNNLKSIFINTANDKGRTVNIVDDGANDPITFLDNIPKATQYDVYLQSKFDPKLRDITTLFNPDVIRLGTVLFKGQQLYYNEQAANFIPFPSATAQSYIPTILLDKTNSALFSQYGLAIGGIVAPASATTNPRINGLLGPSSTYDTDLQLTSAKYTRYLADSPSYTLKYKYFDPAKKAYVSATETSPRQLIAGWNVLTINDPVDGVNQPRSLLVYGDDTAPLFSLDATSPLIVNRADVDNGSTYYVSGQILDDSFGSKLFKTSFKLNDPNHVEPAYLADGTTVDPDHLFIKFDVVDFAGNKYTVKIELTVSDSAILLKDLGRKDLPTTPPSDTLIDLILVLDPPKK